MRTRLAITQHDRLRVHMLAITPTCSRPGHPSRPELLPVNRSITVLANVACNTIGQSVHPASSASADDTAMTLDSSLLSHDVIDTPDEKPVHPPGAPGAAFNLHAIFSGVCTNLLPGPSARFFFARVSSVARSYSTRTSHRHAPPPFPGTRTFI
jgi:hypothetical protein